MTDANDRQVGGDRYKRYEIDPWDAIAIFCPKRLVGAEIYLWGCAFKHLVRLGSKDPVLEDLEKAEHYLQKLHQMLEKKLVDRIGAPSGTPHETTINPHAKIKFENPAGPNHKSLRGYQKD